MRELLNLFDVLKESTGLAGRKSGDVFKNPEKEEIYFDEIKFFPEGGGKYSPEELDSALTQVQRKIKNIIWQNARSPRTGGFAIAKFNNEQGAIYFGRYLESIKPDPTDNYVPNNVGDYKFSSKSAEKVQAQLGPQDLLTDKTDLTIPKIMNQLAASLGTDNPLYAVAHKIAIGEPLPMTFNKPNDISFTAFRDYFCEILQPMALQKGQYTGNAGEAAEKFLGYNGFSKTVISFDDSKTAGLSDSIITNKEGASILVSSKGGKGATASVGNLFDKILQLEETPDGKKFLRKYKEEIEIIKEIKSKGQAGAPLYLGIKYNIINEKEANQILGLKDYGPVSVDSIDQVLSPKLRKLALSRSMESNTVNLYYHLIAAVAHKAASEVNEHTNFSKAAADILNHGGLVQVYTKAKEGKDTWTLSEFETVYPGSSIKGVYLSAGKTYYSTGIKGNYTFKIDKGQGPEKEEEPTPGKPMKSVASVATDITDKKKSVRRQEKEVGNVGREKRK